MAQDTVFVYTMNKSIQGGAWSRYVFPWIIEHFAYLQDSMYIREGDKIHRIVETSNDDSTVGFLGVIQWPWLDFGQPGVDKMLIGFDNIGEGTSSIEISYDQSQPANFTPTLAIPADSVPGQIIPLGVVAPSMSVKLTYDLLQDWEWKSFTLFLNDLRPSA